MTLPSSVDFAGSPRRVRTRFAPSPTGMLHVGALRTALFSFLLARHFDGDFILRIEDTDQNRLVPSALQNLILSLRQMGMDYDEGPDKTSVANLDAAHYGNVDPNLLPDDGGKYGPYFQSQRLLRYNELLNQLIDAGRAYYAFETKEELDGMRAAMEARKLPFLYDRHYRDYPTEEARARVAAGEAHVIRFKMPVEGPIITHDALRGETIWDAATQDDFVIKKGDGFPPYHFASMVDDYDMEISHVLRGEEWLPSFPKHVCLFQAFGWALPVFVHTPSVLGPDSKKLAKRHGAKGVGEYLNDGFLQESLVNFLALVGWSPGNDDEILPLDEIISRFDVPGISTSPAIFDVEKLTWMNGVYIRNLPVADLTTRTLPFLQKPYFDPSFPLPIPPAEDKRPVMPAILPAELSAGETAYAGRVIALEQERMKRLDEAPDLTGYFFGELPPYAPKSVTKWLQKEGVGAYLSDLRNVCADPNTVFEHDALEAVVRMVGARHERERGELTHPVRVAVSGRENGPGLFDIMVTLGREKVVARLDYAVTLSAGDANA